MNPLLDRCDLGRIGYRLGRSDADDVEQHACPKCDAQPGSPCRSRGGAVASAYHTRRFTKVPRLKKALRVPTPAAAADRGGRAPRRRRSSTRTCRARTSASATPGARPSGRNSTPNSMRSASTASPATGSSARRPAPGYGSAPGRPGAGDARRPAARDLRPDRPGETAVRVLRRDGGYLKLADHAGL
ncbi:zinc finger domain-containing protein [Streptomyces sp. O3]